MPVRDPMRLALALVLALLLPGDRAGPRHRAARELAAGGDRRPDVPRAQRARRRGHGAGRRLPPEGRARDGLIARRLDARGAPDGRGALDGRTRATRSTRAAREDFKVRLGPLPDEPRIVFKALQHYADGQVVRWIQDPSDERAAGRGARPRGQGEPRERRQSPRRPSRHPRAVDRHRDRVLRSAVPRRCSSSAPAEVAPGVG